MTKADIAQRLNDTCNFSIKESIDLVDEVMEILKETLEKGEIVKLSGFGNFIVKQKSARRGRNPQNGATITIEARRILSFKPSNKLRDAINR